MADDAASLVRARLLLAQDPEDPRAVVVLRQVLVVDDTGPSMFAPEAAARLAVLLARSHPGEARCCIERALELTGPRMHPRERVCVLMARAAVLAHDDGAWPGPARGTPSP